ncbi:hypothetical protein LVY72_08720 [Arthrobacter sp. I2-34]|uniref:Lipoprotein n=1 Tax=Arthrobacter hankyongi TaxID=2904801 RepID=A0ABS9L5Q5_9MICC|nr:hypothetical protein [Arthrobacter hankyongi]MCG2621999.1 hypothetical protein [Arthrobacter hankyongi]
MLVLAASLAGCGAKPAPQATGTATASPATSGPEPVIAVFSAPEPTWGDVSLPPEVKLTADELARLGQMNVPDQAAWLQERGGVIAGNRRVQLTLKANGPDQVQVTGIRDVSVCSVPRRGTLLRLIPEASGAVPSVGLGISVGESGSGAWTSDSSGAQRPYFPGKAITLAPDGEKRLLVDLVPGRQGVVCQPELELTVVVDGREQLQRISGEGKLVPVMKSEDDGAERQYSAVYLGGRLCPQYVPAVPGWRDNPDFRHVCGLDRVPA